MSREPIVELDVEYSSAEASPTDWAAAERRLTDAGVYWVSTVRPDRRPHVTPIAGIWMDGAFYFFTGAHERKARNLSENAHCVVTTGCNEFLEGLDVVVEGEAKPVNHDATLRRLANELATKYSDFFGFEAREGAFVHGEGGVAEVFEVAPARAFAYGRGEQFSATRFRFQPT